MSKHSATTYISVTTPVPCDIEKVIADARPEAARRLGGEDGLVCKSHAILGGGTTAMVWLREWEEPDVVHEEPKPDTPEEDKQ